MSERTGTDILPAGERGEIRITRQQQIDIDAVSLEAVSVLATHEAESRGLDVQVSHDIVTGDVIVKWRSSF